MTDNICSDRITFDHHVNYLIIKCLFAYVDENHFCHCKIYFQVPTSQTSVNCSKTALKSQNCQVSQEKSCNSLSTFQNKGWGTTLSIINLWSSFSLRLTNTRKHNMNVYTDII